MADTPTLGKVGFTSRMDYSTNPNGVSIPTDPATGKDVIASAPTATTPTITEKPVAIVTSNASKTNYSNNVSTMNTANNNIRAVQAGQSASGIAASLGMTPEKFLELNPQFGAKGNTGDYKGLSGIIQPGQTYKIAPDGTPTVVTDTAADTTKNPDGTTKTTDGSSADGSTSYTTTAGTAYTVPKGGDPTVYKLMYDNIDAMTKSAADAKTAIDTATQYDVNTDPAAIAAANNIKAQFDKLIEQMKEKNNILLGSYGKNSARSGMLQYANEMDTNFKSMEFDKATERITDLVQKQLDAVNKSNEAYKSGNLKALDAATKEYNQVLKEKQNAIMDLNKSINDAVKLEQDAAKLAASEAKQQVTDDIRISTSLSTSIADAIIKSGVTDEAKIDEYINSMAEESGINDVNILKSAVVKAQQAQTKLNLQNENTQLTINKKKAPKSTNTTKPYAGFTSKPTAATITKVNTYLSSIGASNADIKKVNSDEASFYKVLNAIP